jgi:hypothetical protein
MTAKAPTSDQTTKGETEGKHHKSANQRTVVKLPQDGFVYITNQDREMLQEVSFSL